MLRLLLLTNHCLDFGPLQCGQSQVSYLDQTCGAIDEDVVTLEVPMDDRRGPGVEKLEPFQNLSPPAPNHLWLDGFEPSHEAMWEKKGEV